MTTADRPEIMVPQLKRPTTNLRQGFTGTFKVEGDRLSIRVSKVAEGNSLRGRNHHRDPTSHIHLTVTARIENRRRTYSTRLAVMSWDTTTVREGVAGPSTRHEINKFLPFIFSRLRPRSTRMPICLLTFSLMFGHSQWWSHTFRAFFLFRVRSLT